jgi:hypothetical protein
MATKKTKVEIPADEKLEAQDFDMFRALEALDRKDYGFYSRLTDEQKKKFVPYMLLHWMATVSGSADLQRFYLMNTDIVANTYFLNERVNQHPELQWLMLCSASPGIGKQFHKWIPTLSKKVATLEATITAREAADYYGKLYPRANKADLTEIGRAYSEQHKHKVELAKRHPELSVRDIDVLAEVFTSEQLKEYEKASGN